MRNKQGIFSKSNYDVELEELLEQKNYTDEAKSLILNVIYKIESSYNDYKKTKPNAKSKFQIIKDIVETIENRCDRIEVMNPKESNGKLYVSRKNKLIKTFPNDNDLLQAIYYIKTPCTKGIANVFEKAVLVALEKGMAINGVEIIRDFNGWSWNNILDDEQEQYYNLLYQNLIILIDETDLEDAIKSPDVIQALSERLTNLYGNVRAEAVVSKLVKACVLIYMNSNDDNEKEVFDYLNKKQSELYEMTDKSAYISKITKENQERTKIVSKIDSILASKNLLNKKFSSKSISEKYGDIESYKISLIKYKSKILNDINESKKITNPFEYVKQKKLIQEDVKKLNDIKVGYSNENIVFSTMLDLQKKVISCLHKKIEVYDLKKELVNLVYEIRYYNFLFLEGERLKKFEELKKDIDKLQLDLVRKLLKNRIITTFSDRVHINYDVAKYIFITKTVNLEKINFKFKREGNYIKVQYYGEEILEHSVNVEITEGEFQGLTKKENKKIKILI